MMTPPSAQRGKPADPRRWPDVARVPPSGARSRVAHLLAEHAFTRVPIRVNTPNGPMATGGGAGAPLLRLHRPADFHRRLARDGLIGFGESYMAGDWDSPELVPLLTTFAEHYEELIPRALQPLRHLTLPRRPANERASRAGARRNAGHHYDLSNALFATFLDETMTYSAALFEDGNDRAGLAAAQRRKIDRLLDGAGVAEGTRLLEIGTGWGELAVRAARRGARVTSITLSPEQRDLARARASEAGVGQDVDIALCDYREVAGRFDAVVSVEMIEAVGERYWPVFATALDRSLRPGGRVGLQMITMGHQLMRASRHTHTWMHKYIFPGGLIPSVHAIEENLRLRTALRITDRLAFGPDYARTLRIWRETFDDATENVADLGFDDTFRRMWHFYLAYCEAGFRAGMLGVEQLIMERD